MTAEGLLAASQELIQVRGIKQGKQRNVHFLSLFKDIESVYDAIGNVTRAEVTFENVIKPMIDNDGESIRKIAALKVGMFSFIAEGKNKKVLYFSVCCESSP